MKLAKLSLAAMVVAGLASSSFAASDTLADAFKNGKVNGELRAWYFDRDSGTAATSSDIFNTGVSLGYVTDSLYGLSLGATFQSNYAGFADTTAKKVFDGDSYGSGAVLSEAYVAYTLGKTTAKVGRQFISTPLVNGSGSRMIKEAFEGVVVVNTDIPQTTLIAGYVDKFQGRTSQVTATETIVDGTSDVSSFKKSIVAYGLKNAGGSLQQDSTKASNETVTFDAVYTIGAINKSVNNLTLTAQFATVNNVADTNEDLNAFYTEANYVLPVSSFKLGFDANYRGSRFGVDDSGLDGDMWSGRIGLIDLAGFGASFAYSTTSKNDAVVLGVGNGPTSYTAPLIAAAGKTASADTDAYKIELTYDFSKVGVPGLKVLGHYVSITADKLYTFNTTTHNADLTPTDFTYWAGQVAYDIPAVKGLTLSLEYEDAKAEAAKTTNSNELRFRANYKF